MRVVLRTLFFHLVCVLFFGAAYWLLTDHFVHEIENETPRMIDFMSLSMTVQAGVGMSQLVAVTTLSKLMLIIQQFLMISTNVFLLYIFTQ